MTREAYRCYTSAGNYDIFCRTTPYLEKPQQFNASLEKSGLAWWNTHWAHGSNGTLRHRLSYTQAPVILSAQTCTYTVYVCVCVCIHTNKHTRYHTQAPGQVQLCAQKHTNHIYVVCVFLCIHQLSYTITSNTLCTQTHKHTNTQIHKYTYTQIHKYTYTQIHIPKHKHIKGYYALLLEFIFLHTVEL